jgi:hypothetical protein
MNTHEQGEMKYISMGVVAMNKQRGTDMVDVWPIGIISELDDELTNATQDFNVKGLDDNGKTVVFKVTRGATIPCKWRGDRDTNRVTSPDVRRGERVKIYQLGDSEQYFWETEGRDSNLRRLETVVYRYSALPTNEDAELDDNNSYFHEINTHDGFLLWKTSQANSEKALWTIMADAAKGIYILEDEKGNHFYIDSVNTDIKMRNANDAFVQLIKDVINIKAPDTLNIDAPNINVNSEKTNWNNSGAWKISNGSTEINTSGTAKYTAGGQTIIKGSQIMLN